MKEKAAQIVICIVSVILVLAVLFMSNKASSESSINPVYQQIKMERLIQ